MVVLLCFGKYIGIKCTKGVISYLELKISKTRSTTKKLRRLIGGEPVTGFLSLTARENLLHLVPCLKTQDTAHRQHRQDRHDRQHRHHTDYKRTGVGSLGHLQLFRKLASK